MLSLYNFILVLADIFFFDSSSYLSPILNLMILSCYLVPPHFSIISHTEHELNKNNFFPDSNDSTQKTFEKNVLAMYHVIKSLVYTDCYMKYSLSSSYIALRQSSKSIPLKPKFLRFS